MALFLSKNDFGGKLMKYENRDNAIEAIKKDEIVEGIVGEKVLRETTIDEMIINVDKRISK